MKYSDSGVDVKKGDEASKNAYENAKTTFSSRQNLIGKPFQMDGGFAGALDMGEYLLIQNDDGVGTKMEIAEKLNKFDTIGEDLVAMVADDAICVGAEVISLTNTLDTPKVDPLVIKKITKSLAESCFREKIVIPGGEIAELGKALNKMVWNATAVGIVKKDKFITGENIKSGQKIIGLQGRVLRSNGFSLARKICEKNFGKNWETKEWQNGKTWGEVLLTPSKIFHRILLENISGDFAQTENSRNFPIHGIVHITGGGIFGNFPRVFPNKNLGAEFFDLHSPHQAVKDLVEVGNVDEEEAYKTWHCGTAMMLVVDEKSATNICEILNNKDEEIKAKIVGEINNSGKISVQSKFSDKVIIF